MIIVIVDLETTPADRPIALAHLDRAREEARAMPGNLAYRVDTSREQDTRITLTHEWADEASFAQYLASDSFARAGQEVRPLMTAAPVSRRFRAEALETAA